MSPRQVFWLSYVLLLLALGFLAWDKWGNKPAVVAEQPAPAVRQPDGSLVSEKRIDPEAKPKQMLPKGSKPVRVGHVVVQPKDEKAAPVSYDWTLAKNKDGTQSMLTSSKDGTVTDAVDIVVEADAARKRGWSVGAAGTSNGYAVWMGREIGRLPLLDVPVKAVVLHTTVAGQSRNFVGGEASW